MRRTLLAIDVGNTNTVLGFFRGPQLVRTWRVISVPGVLLKLKLPETNAVIVSSVVPRLKAALETLAHRASGKSAVFVTPSLKMPVRVTLKNPKQVGQDRIVNAVAAYDRWKRGLIIVDLGTATTCDVVTPKGEYIGGTISPGIGIANAALHEKTALLPLVPVARPPRAVGRNTVEAIRSGVFYGYVGLIDGLVERIKKELPFPVKVISTGGLSALVGRASRAIDVVDPDLTLKGLQKLDDWNHRV
ncbi:MAG TPA: type III pantothenate kinase [bacterium]|nr:type III pantothenate kinase [bacterium]